LNALREKNPIISSMGELFLEVAEQFKVYEKYCANYLVALQLYKELKNREDIKAYLDVSVVERMIFDFYSILAV
jgi:hypothetical protein